MDEEQFELLRQFTEELVPFNRVIGLHLEAAEEGSARLRFDFRPELVGNYKLGVLHGGVISTVLDVTGACAVATTYMEEGTLHGMGTVDMRVDFLNPGRGEHFTATGRVMRPGRILCATRMELANEAGELIAIGQGIYRVSRREEALFLNV